MTKKLVSFIFIIALVASSILMLNSGFASLTNTELKSNFGSQNSNNALLLQSGQQKSALSKLSTVNSISSTPRVISYPYSNTNFTTSQSSYQPGDWVNTTGYVGFNGTMSFSLKTPNANDQPVFNPYGSANQTFFKDPALTNTTGLTDWLNNGFNITHRVGYMNLTSTSSSGNSTLSYNQFHDFKGTFQLQFYYRLNSTGTNNMTIQYYNGTNVKYINVNYPSSSNPTPNGNLILFRQNITLDTTNPAYSLPLNITLKNNPPETWIISNIKVLYDIQNIPLTDNQQHTGVLESVWVHGSESVQRDVIKIYYFVNQTTVSHPPYISFNFTLPKLQIYMGDWEFDVHIQPINDKNVPLSKSQTLQIPILVQYNLYFDMQKQYIYRGSYTNGTAIYKDETNITNIYSPTDEVVYVGQIFTNVTKTKDIIDSSYFSSITGVLNSNTTIAGTQNYAWTNSSFSKYNPIPPNSFQNKTLYYLLPNSLKSNYTWVIPTSIPNRGIFGRVNQTLNLTFPTGLISANTSSNDFKAINSLITLDPATVEFNLNVTGYNIPFNRTWFLTEFMEGNFSVSTWRYNLSYVSQFQNPSNNQTFPLQLNIPKSDLIFNVYLQNNSTKAMEQIMPIQLLSNAQTFYFAGSISPNLNTQDLYHLGINWLNPLYSKEPSAKAIQLPFSPTEKSLYTIKGTLTITLPLTLVQFRQGDNFQVQFNVTIDQLAGRPATGLLMNAIVENSTTLAPITSLNPQIFEADGVFTVFMTIPYYMPLGIYNMQLFKTSTNTTLGFFQFKIIPHVIDPQDITTVIPNL